MLSNQEKITYLQKVKRNLEEAILNSDLEIRLWERKKILAKDQVLIALENMITAHKKDRELFQDKLEVVEDEIKDYEKQLARK